MVYDLFVLVLTTIWPICCSDIMVCYISVARIMVYLISSNLTPRMQQIGEIAYVFRYKLYSHYYQRI